MTVEQFGSLILIAVIKHWSVVARKHYDSIVGNAEFVESLHELTYSPVELHDSVAAQSHTALSAEARMRETWHMYVVGAEVHEERIVLIGLDEVDSVRCDRVGDVLVLPQSLAATLHISYTADAVDDRLVVTAARCRLQIVQQFGVVLASRFAREVLLIAYMYRCRRVVVGNIAVFNEYTWHTVGCSSHDVVIVETYI